MKTYVVKRVATVYTEYAVTAESEEQAIEEYYNGNYDVLDARELSLKSEEAEEE